MSIRVIVADDQAMVRDGLVALLEVAPDIEVSAVTLESGERLVLVTDGITERTVEGGGRFGVDGLRRAVQRAEAPTAAALPKRALAVGWPRLSADSSTTSSWSRVAVWMNSTTAASSW